ncbi:hypothetical protein N5U36_00535 [Aliarcobacter butzleri]|uniref:hypothetical protein n=1 Tax=Aliarcobacter butzleri TaxID=28197 RepID=UPI0021B2E666|nr:hypothetical protein [Aliarcobacter butzleri]MCT7633919.1 hypothetical protein [Aliarcobacter butzleri]
MPKFDVPKLADYSGAIQANQSFQNAFRNLGQQSQDFLNYEENKKQNEWNNVFKQQDFNYTKDKDNRSFEYEQNRDAVKDNQWQQGHNLQKDSLAFDQNYKTNVFNHNVNQDNINNGYKADEMKYRWANAFKPEYTTFNGVDANGNPTLSMIDKNTGKVFNTGQQVYNESKKLAPEQSLYYMDRANEMKQKQLLELEKTFRESNEFSKLEKEDQMKAIDYLRTTEKPPQIEYEKGLFGKGYYLPQKTNTNKAIEDAKKQNEQYKQTLGN